MIRFFKEIKQKIKYNSFLRKEIASSNSDNSKIPRIKTDIKSKYPIAIKPEEIERVLKEDEATRKKFSAY